MIGHLFCQMLAYKEQTNADSFSINKLVLTTILIKLLSLQYFLRNKNHNGDKIYQTITFKISFFFRWLFQIPFTAPTLQGNKVQAGVLDAKLNSFYFKEQCLPRCVLFHKNFILVRKHLEPSSLPTLLLRIKLQVAVSQGGWRTTSVIKLRVDVNLSQMKVTCSAINNLFEDKFEETKIIKILSKLFILSKT